MEMWSFCIPKRYFAKNAAQFFFQRSVVIGNSVEATVLAIPA